MKHPKGECPVCGVVTSAPGRRCSKHGRELAGKTKTENTARRKWEAEKRTAIALLRDWGHRHGGVGPTMSAWDDAGYTIRALRVLYLFDGWITFIDTLHLEHPSRTKFSQRTDGLRKNNRRMVTGGDLGAKTPAGDAPHVDRSIPYV